MLRNWWQSGWGGCGSAADEVGEAGDGIGGDAEAIAEVGPERDGILLAGLFQREEGVPALPSVLATSAAAYSVTSPDPGERLAAGRRAPVGIKMGLIRGTKRILPYVWAS